MLILRLFVLLFLALALAGMVIWYEGKIDAADYVVVIDSSGSMAADDFMPNRLEAAKEAAVAFVENLESKSKVGIVSFAGVGFVELPLTENRGRIKKAIEEIKINTLHGTAISESLKTAANLLVTNDRSRVIILLTDGRENVAGPEELEKIVEYVYKNQIMVNTIGVATEEGGILPGVGVLSTLDEAMLYRVANSTGGHYTHSANKDDLVNAFKSFTYEQSEGKIPIRMRLHLMMIVFAILFFEWVLVNTRYRTIP
jgi:Ca-activated chloride channel family protein